MKNKTLILVVAASLLSGLTGCGPKTEEAEVSTMMDTSPTMNDILLEEVPESVPSLLEALNDANPGDTIVFTARIGGTEKPISEVYAGFVVADESLVFCDEMGNDGHCPMPWDACCEDSDKVADSRAFVQLVDDSGNLTEMDLKSTLGISENDTVVIKGRLSPESAPRNVIIIAEGLAVVD